VAFTSVSTPGVHTGEGARCQLPRRLRAGLCKDPQVATDSPAVAELVAEVATAVGRQAAAVSEDVYKLILREIPQLDDDKPLVALLASSVDSNVGTCLQIMQHRINLSAVQAPAAASEYARRLAQRGTPLTALLRAYRIGHACVSDWLLEELAQQADDAEMVAVTALSMSGIVAGYVDQTSEEMVAAYTQERENWLRGRNAARAAVIRDLLVGERIDMRAAEVTLGYRLRQYHVGILSWAGDAAGTDHEIARLERAIGHVAGQAACSGEPVFLPRDESSAWAWLPLGIRDTFDAPAASTAGPDGDIHFAFGDPAKGPAGFRLTHQQALAAQAVALAGGSPPRTAVTFSQVAPVAMMLGSAGLLRAWVLATLAGLATDDEHHARLRDTLLVFLHTGGSYKTTAERLVLHKNTVQYRIRKAQESLGRPIGENRRDVELALQASHWLGSSVLQPRAASAARPELGLGLLTLPLQVRIARSCDANRRSAHRFERRQDDFGNRVGLADHDDV
jgi:PucR C-terminal helix-turn-helix domain/GGDEF-like domain